MRLIDAHKLHNALYEVYEKHRKEGNEYICEVMSKQIEPIILAASTVDAVEVVRCKGCKWSKKAETVKGSACGWLSTDNTEIIVFDDDFCNYGRRKESDI